MTTTPTPDEVLNEWDTHDWEHSLEGPHSCVTEALRQAIVERDHALARVKELEAEPGSFASWVAERHRAEKA